MSKVAINGRFLARRMTGQERFAYEVVLELDKIIKKGNVVLVVPEEVKSIPQLVNIEVVKYGKIKGTLWEQVCFAWYVLKNKMLSLNLCTIQPLIKPGIVCIHDISYKVNPHLYSTTLYLKLSTIWHKLNYIVAWKYSPRIYTVSQFSKKQIQEVYHVDEKKINVIVNGWQHFNRVEEDYSIFEKWPQLKKGNYFFMLGSLSPNKNVEWILNAAKYNSKYQFAIAGNANLKAFGKDYSEVDIPNVNFLGFIEDGQVKALMRNCKAFIFPSLFEGFGIPPLEAMSVGAKVIVANTSCLPEIYGDAAYYIDPNNPKVNLDDLLNVQVSDNKSVLNKYSFENSAKDIWKDIQQFM